MTIYYTFIVLEFVPRRTGYTRGRIETGCTIGECNRAVKTLCSIPVSASSTIRCTLATIKSKVFITTTTCCIIATCLAFDFAWYALIRIRIGSIRTCRYTIFIVEIVWQNTRSTLSRVNTC